MARKKKSNYPLLMEVVKLTFIFAAALGVFGMIFVFTFGIGRLGSADASADEISACPEIYSPVCGSDGTTYANGCFASNSNAEIACNGECPCGDNDEFEINPPLVY